MSDAPEAPAGIQWSSWLAKLGFGLALLSAVLLVAIGVAYRWGAIASPRDAFGLVEWVVYGGAGAGLVAFIGGVLAIRRNRPLDIALASAGVIVAFLVVWVPYSNRAALRASPPLSDITTDTRNPPAFVRALELREQSKARNPATYGPDKAKLQNAHYPDIRPLHLALSPDAAFEQALAAARDLGWTVVAADKEAGRIEAHETSLLFGFVDDVVVRVRADGPSSRIDVRSSSRVGRRDAAANANRVRRFLKAVAAP